MPIFLKLGDVEGEATADGHEGEIEIMSYSFGASNSGSMIGANKGSGTSQITDMSLTHMMDKASPNLFAKCYDGEVIDEAVLTIQKTVGGEDVDYQIYTMDSVLVTSAMTSGSSGGDDKPMESFSLNFAQLGIKYTPIKDDGSEDAAIEHGWDLTTGQPK